MKDIAVPPLVAGGHRGQPLRTCRRATAWSAPDRVAFSRREGTAAGSTSPARSSWPRSAPWPRAWSPPASTVGDRVGHHEQDPLRVDAGRLRHLDRRRGRRCRSTRPPRPSRSAGSSATPTAWPSSSRRRRTPRRWPRSATGCRACATSGRSTTAAWTSSRAAGADDHRRRPRRSAAAGLDRARHRDDHLHLRHDRPAQGLRADARQLPRRSTENTVERARPTWSAPRAPRPCCSCRSRTCSPGSSRCCASTAGARMGHSADIKNLLDDFGELPARPSSSRCRGSSRRSTTPPRPKATAEGKGRIFARGRRAPPSPGAEAHDDGGPGPLLAAAARACSTGWSTASCAPRWAARSQYAVSGGGPLGTRLGHFYRGIGVTILEGYGLTETTAPATVNTPDQIKIGTVGPPLPGVAIRIADDGEVLHQGRQRLRALPQQRRRPPRRRSSTAGSTPATSASSTTTASCGSPAARRSSSSPPAARTSRRRCSRTGCAPTRSSPSASSSATRSRSSPRCVTLDAEMLPAWATNHGLDGLTVEQARTTRGGPRRDPEGRRRRQQGGQPRPSRSASSRSSPATSPRRTATSRRR